MRTITNKRLSRTTNFVLPPMSLYFARRARVGSVVLVLRSLLAGVQCSQPREWVTRKLEDVRE